MTSWLHFRIADSEIREQIVCKEPEVGAAKLIQRFHFIGYNVDQLICLESSLPASNFSYLLQRNSKSVLLQWVDRTVRESQGGLEMLMIAILVTCVCTSSAAFDYWRLLQRFKPIEKILKYPYVVHAEIENIGLHSVAIKTLKVLKQAIKHQQFIFTTYVPTPYKKGRVDVNLTVGLDYLLGVFESLRFASACRQVFSK
ncbi:unnamed protein product [Cylicocyclus nassatus]|uniref:Uncharacterized protein n=1 Tax=Cylicocyclus nassatus TaxID=53992 RepID=A0AA36M4F4_CYLNA|nr:unnamed protein product [Cylicocyclus nassatus]